VVIWLTGLPGAGKTTVATILMTKLRAVGKQTLLIDGDKIRDVLHLHSYDIESRKNIALTYARLGKMFSEQGSISICSTVSMFDCVRNWNAENIGDYFEVYIKVSHDVLQQRNQKELYSDAVKGKAVNVLGFDIAVQEPKTPNLVLINDGLDSPEHLADKIFSTILGSVDK
jgi:adenylylsulfate kinase-like enzyme